MYFDTILLVIPQVCPFPFPHFEDNSIFFNFPPISSLFIKLWFWQKFIWFRLYQNGLNISA